jgi:N,N-dimethylformamidase beta subunit-like, C-terminal
VSLVTIKRARLGAAALALAGAATLATAACTSTATAQHGSASPGPATSALSHTTARPFPVEENKRSGTSAWRITDLGAPGAIDGYADRQSVLPGQSFRLYVSTTAKSFRVKAFRFGWYQGHQARLVWTSRPTAGQRQATVSIAPGTHMVTAPWHPSLTISTGDWPPGSYLLRLDASSGAERYVPITVRSASTAGAVVILNDNTTWQAYNTWGGYSLYQGPDGLPRDRGYAVSFDRPYDGDGAVRFLAFDQAAIALAEKTGVSLAYETDVDIDQHPGLLAGARAVITLGHDEYYSLAMRNALTRARNAGTNLAFLGANAIYRHIRFADGDRVIICYKAAAIDPLFGQDNADTTQQWRDPPDPRPESVITGVFYECNPVSAPWVVYDPSNWIFAGTGAYKGERFAGLVGPEYDRLNPAVPFPRPMQVLAHSPLTCDGFSTLSDSVYYTVASGAGVFASGTMRWVCAMRGPHCGHGLTRAAERFVDRATQNLLRAFAAGPAGRSHPARDNVAQVRPPRITALSDGVD